MRTRFMLWYYRTLTRIGSRLLVRGMAGTLRWGLIPGFKAFAIQIDKTTREMEITARALNDDDQ